MTITVFNPNWFYTEVLSKEQHNHVDKIFKQFLNDNSNFHNPWDSVCLSTYQHQNNNTAPWEEFITIIQPITQNLIDTLKPRNPIKCYTQEAWANKYREREYQETHTHSLPGVNMSLVYFHQVSENDTSFKFVSDSFSNYSLSGLHQLFDIPNNQLFIPKVETGTVMFFPSFLPHYVSPHNTPDYERITFSANFMLVPVE